MGTKICMNTSCGAKVSSTWKKGWELKSGQLADLCLNCGSVYEKLAYCDTFHAEETGWRECSLCNKRLHCGCSASLTLIEIQDFGGIWCIECARNAGCHLIRKEGPSSEAPKPNTYSFGEQHNPQSCKKLDGSSLDDAKLLSLGIPAKSIYFGLQMEIKNPIEFARKGFENLSQPPIEPPKFPKSSDDRPNIGVRDVQETQILPSLNISLGTTDSPSFSLALPSGAEEGERSRTPLIQPMHRPRHILPKLARANFPKSSGANKGPTSQKRIARPPAEAKLRSQLLPRYWPRITDQELQKLSGDLSSTVVPLFEKVLSASDASRIGRLVLPKACAEAYFPHINNSEGLPLKVQDVKGNEWAFQFRFWPNNNSRMYVLEGVTPCIQSMQLQAGDTVTFSRIDPGGKLVVGCRKASSSFETQVLWLESSHFLPNLCGISVWILIFCNKQDKQISAPHDGVVSEDNFHSEGSESKSTANGWSNLNILSEQSIMPNGDTGWSKNGIFKGKMSEDFLQQPTVTSDKRKARNIGLKNKRLLIQQEEALELRITWEETQDLLRPQPSDQPTVVMIEEFEFEEYNEAPVFGKRTLFTTGLIGGQNQWAQCDKCAKWRKLPLDVLLPPTWSCMDNVWDLSRSSCSAPEEINSKELDLSRTVRESKRRRVTAASDIAQRCEPSGLDALANAAVLDDHARVSAEPPSGATTRHPRHRPGCSCIVCIQPPSGKGKHKSNCTCNVCLTVKRRFKTLMMRKKKRQGERDAEMTQQITHGERDAEMTQQITQGERDAEMTQQITQDDHGHHPTEESTVNILPSPSKDTVKIEESKQNVVQEGESNGKGIIDLNFCPSREEDAQVEPRAGISRPIPVEAPNTPLEICMNNNSDQNEATSLLYDKQEPSSIPPLVQPQGNEEINNNQNPVLEPKPEPEPKDELEHRPEPENVLSSTTVEGHDKDPGVPKQPPSA